MLYPLGKMRRLLLGVLSSLVFSTVSGWASARGRPLIAEPVEGEKIRIDGDLREWPAKTAALDAQIRGDGLSAGAVIGYDSNNIYLALRTADRRIARTAAAGELEDHATLVIAFPKGRDYVTYEVWIHPGKPGKSPAKVSIAGKAVNGAKAVENPSSSGLLLEAQIPWAAFREGRTTRVGLRAAVNYTDCDAAGTVKSVSSTSEGQTGTGLPPLLLESEQALQALLKDNGLSDLPAREAYGNLAGGALLERVAVFGKFLTVSGPEFRGGKELSFIDVGIGSSGAIVKIDLDDFDGDGHDEIVVRKRVGSREKYREILEVLKVGRDDTPFTAFAHEVGIKTPDGSIANKVEIDDGAITISQGKYEGFEVDSYSEPLPNKMPSAILPWQEQKSKTFRWQGTGFSAGAGDDGSGGERALPAKAEKRSKKAESRPEPARLAPRPPTAEEMLDRVYALYKRERGVAGGKPRFDFVSDVSGDSTPERVLIHQKDIVVFGKGFRGGQSYAFITAGVVEPKDILDATASDLTGDGKAEVIVRAVLRAKASKALGGDMVDRHALLVYGVRGDTVVRLFGAETGRSVGKNQILGAVNFSNSGGSVRIELRPSRAIGWTEDSYPFPPDTTAAGGLEPLLLPWTSDKRSYRYDGTSFVRD
jgi:hypothetical protein